MIDIRTTIRSARFRKENGWGVWETDLGVVKGVIPWEPQAGEIVILSGDWTKSTYTGGDEFAIRKARAHVETDPRALLHYACTLTSGLGEAKEEEIWLLHGPQWREARELEGVVGIRRGTVNEWQMTLNRIEMEAARAEAVAWLLDHGCTDNLALAAFERWAEATVGTVRENPYRLAELPRYGFLFVDEKVAPRLGIGRDDPRRASAALLYALSETVASTGDSAPAVEAVEAVACQWIEPGQFRAALEAETEAGRVVYAGPGHITTPNMLQAETAIWEYACN